MASTTSGSLPPADALVMSVESWSSGTATCLVLMPVLRVNSSRIAWVALTRSGWNSLFQTVIVWPFDVTGVAATAPVVATAAGCRKGGRRKGGGALHV